MTPACPVWFYHLERCGAEEVLPELLERARERGWRSLVRSPFADRLKAIDERLWTYRDDSFLPHGLDEEPFSDRQPVLLTTGPANSNGAAAVFLLDGADWGDLQGVERCVLVFDGREAGELARARESWRALKTQTRELSYWRQTAEGWKQG
jgi:DNA polymerase-3 subunit chi